MKSEQLIRLAPLGFLYGAVLLLSSALFDSPRVVAYGFADGSALWRMNMVGLAFLFCVFFFVTWDVTKRVAREISEAE